MKKKEKKEKSITVLMAANVSCRDSKTNYIYKINILII